MTSWLPGFAVCPARLVNDGPPANIPAPSFPAEIDLFLDLLRVVRDKRRAPFQAVADTARERGLTITITEEESWVIASSDARVAQTAGTKTRLDVHFPVTSAGPVSSIRPARSS